MQARSGRWRGWLAAGLALGLAGTGCVRPRQEIAVAPAVDARFEAVPTADVTVGPPSAVSASVAGPQSGGLISPDAPADTIKPVSYQQPTTPAPQQAAPSTKQTSENNPPREPVPAPKQLSGQNPVYCHLDDIDIRQALEMASRGTGYNIIVSPNITGKITANLSGLGPEQAIDAIVQLGHLVTTRANGVLYVYTADEAKAAAEREGRLPVRVYHLNYVRAIDIEKLIKPLLSKDGKMSTSAPSQQGITTGNPFGGAPGQPGMAGSPSSGAMPPPSAQSTPTPGTGVTGGDSMAGGDVMIVRDQEPILRMIDTIVAQVDVQPAEVLIEAEIISVELDKEHELGVNFAVLDLSGRALGVVGNGGLLNAAVGFGPAALVSGGHVVGTNTEGFAANEHGVKFGFIGDNVTGFIRALSAVGKTDVLACPRVLVLNKQLAELQLGQQLGYTTLTQNFTSTIQQVDFLNVGTLLRVRPFITSDGMVRMEIHPERSSGQIINNIPQTNTTQVTTNVMVRDGTTIVIGGLMDSEDNDNMFGVPGLCNWPVIGALFRQHQHSTIKKELIVLLTPRVVHPPCAPSSAIPLTVPPMAPTLPAPALPSQVVPDEGVQLQLHESANAVYAGQETGYDILVSNHTDKPLTGVAVEAVFSDGLQPVRAVDAPTAQIEDHRVRLSLLPDLPAGQEHSYRVYARALRDGHESVHVQLSSLSTPAGRRLDKQIQVLPMPEALLGQPQATAWRAHSESLGQ